MCICCFRINDIAVFIHINDFLTVRFYFLLFLTIYWFFLILAPLNAFAEEEWNIEKLDTFTYGAVSGEVIHGDKLRFIMHEDKCDEVLNVFSFYTYEKPGDIYQLKDRIVPIKINGDSLTAKVFLIKPFLMGYQVWFSLGEYPIKQFTYALNEFYQVHKKYEIEIVDGLNFEAKKYFDIPKNNWKLENLVNSMLDVNKKCKELSHTNS